MVVPSQTIVGYKRTVATNSLSASTANAVNFNPTELFDHSRPSYIVPFVIHCGSKACHLDKPSSSAAPSIKPNCELISVFVLLGGSTGACASSVREFCTARLAGGRGGGVAALLTLAEEDTPCGDPVIRRGGGCGIELVGAGEALVRLGAGGGGTELDETGGG